MSDALTSSRRRVPHRSTARFQYVPYAFFEPGVAAASTIGTYSANVGAGGRTGADVTRS
jgi:hypothetical protein